MSGMRARSGQAVNAPDKAPPHVVSGQIAGRALLATAMIGLFAVSAAAQPLPGDHVIVPGSRIGDADLDPADQGSLQRNLGEPNQTSQHGDMATYRYGAPKPDGGSPDELVVMIDLNKDAPFEIATASPAYHTKEGLGVGSTDTAIRTGLGQPLCSGDDGAGNGTIVYGTIWFRTAGGVVTRVSIRKQLSAADFKTGAAHC
jgi:hypothetical protein